MVSKKVGAKKKSRRKIPGAPKRPKSSYMEFSQEERPKIVSDLGTLSLTDMGKELGKRWKMLPPEEKTVY